jgi:hypothetical protein
MILDGTTRNGQNRRVAEDKGAGHPIRHLRNVQRVLQGAVTYDPDGQYSEFYDGVRAVWPTAGTSFQGDPPWPTSPAARLKWLASSGHRTWLPTAAQRADRWLEVHGDAELQERRCRTDPRSG